MLKKSRFIIIGVVLLIAGIAFGLLRKDREFVPESIATARGTIVQEVSVTGRVQSADAVDLAFERAGRVVYVNAKVGSKVQSGTILAGLDAADLQASVEDNRAAVALAEATLSGYQASLASEKARLTELKKGARSEEVAVSQAKVDNAKKSLEDAKEALTNAQTKSETDLRNVYADVVDTVRDAYNKANEAVRLKTLDVLRRSSESASYELTFIACDQTLENSVKEQRRELEKLLTNWQQDTLEVSDSSPDSQLDVALASSMTRINLVKQFLEDIYRITVMICSGRSNPSSYQTNITAGITSVNTAASSLNSQSQSIASQKRTNEAALQTARAAITTAENTLVLVQAELTLKKAQATREQLQIQQALVDKAQATVDAQRAQIEEARARLKSAVAQVEKTLVRAPIAGVVTKADIRAGEIAAPSTVVFSVLPYSNYEAEANVAEVDIAKLTLGMPAQITLDAYGSDVTFIAKISHIDPAETVVDGVPTYKTKFQFDFADPRIKSGMTANIDITTARAENALVLPQRAIITKQGRKFVKVLISEKNVEEREVATGLRGSDGNIEIVSGVQEGEKIVISNEEE